MSYDLNSFIRIKDLKRIAEIVHNYHAVEPTLTVESNNAELEIETSSEIEFETNSDGVISVTSSDESVATATTTYFYKRPMSIDGNENASVIEEEEHTYVNIQAVSPGTAVITLKVGPTLAYKSVTSTINVTIADKTTPTITLSSNSKEVSEGSSDTVTYTTDSDGAASVETSDSSIATATVNNGTITINGVAEGSATITLNLASTSTYTAASAVINVTVVKRTDLESFSWAEIAAIGAQGTGDNYWDVGDTKSLTLNGTVGTLALSNYACKVYIIDFNYKGTNGVYFQGFKDANGIDVALCDSKYPSNSTDGTKCFNMNHKGQTSSSSQAGYYNTNYGGWKGSDLRYDILGSVNTAPSQYNQAKTTANVGYDATSAAKTNPVANTLMAALPADLRTELEPWTVYSDNTGNKSNVAANVTTSVDYLPLLSEFEVQGARTYANNYEQNSQTQMAYFANGNSKIKYRHDDTATACLWWLRSPYCSNADSFCNVTTSGYVSDNYATNSRGVAPAFRLA